MDMRASEPPLHSSLFITSGTMMMMMMKEPRVLLLLSCTCLLVSSFLSVCRYSTRRDQCRTMPLTRIGLQGTGGSIFSTDSCRGKKYIDTRTEGKIVRNVVSVSSSSTTSLWASSSAGNVDDNSNDDEDLVLSLSVKSVEIFESAAGTIKGKKTMVSN